MLDGVEVTIPAETVEMRCSTTRITELSAAKSADLKAGGWTPEKGGEAFNSLIEKFKRGRDFYFCEKSLLFFIDRMRWWKT
jgi:hypothetical protein